MKVSLLITISVGGLVHPVSPKNKGVDSQTQVDESRKAELVTPQLFFALQGLPLPGPGRLSCVASCCRQQSQAHTTRTLGCLNTGIQHAAAPRIYNFSSLSQQISTRCSLVFTERCQPLGSTSALQQSSLMSILLHLEKPHAQGAALCTGYSCPCGWLRPLDGAAPAPQRPHALGQHLHVTLLWASVTKLPFLGIQCLLKEK